MFLFADDVTVVRIKATLDGIDQTSSAPLIRLARIVLWLIAMTACIKPAEIFGPGEQSWAAPPTSDFVFNCLVLAGSVFACLVAFLSGRIRRTSLLFVPFLGWAMFVTVILQADLNSVKQIGSYASWILFYIAASSLLEGLEDYRALTLVLICSVVISALGGEVQHWLGYAPSLGSKWPDSSEMEFGRIHTGGGGILRDAFTPYCAAVLLMSIAGTSLLKHACAWLLVLWGTANILRGGILALGVGLCWYLCMVPGIARKRILPFMLSALLCAGVLFGSTLTAKMSGTEDVINTSGRLDEWPQLVNWIAEEPLVGHGPNADMELLAKSAAGSDLRVAHNELLSTGINYGIVGIILLWVPLLSLLIRSMRQSVKAGFEVREQICGATAVLLMLVVLSLTDNTLRSPGVMIVALAPAAVMRVRRSRATSRWIGDQAVA